MYKVCDGSKMFISNGRLRFGFESMPTPRLDAFDKCTHTNIQARVDAARAEKIAPTQRQNLAVVGFWGFGTTDKRNALIECARYAFRTPRVFCSNVHSERFEGIACVQSTQILLFEQFCDEVGMSTGVVTIGNTRHGQCLVCTDNMPCFLASLSRVEAGDNKTGKHPVYWGAKFREFVVQSRREESVLKTTGVSFDPNNMIMLFMSHRALEFSLTTQRAQFEAVRRSARSRETSSAVVSRENNRILFELQQAYSTGEINADVFQRIAFG